MPVGDDGIFFGRGFWWCGFWRLWRSGVFFGGGSLFLGVFVGISYVCVCELFTFTWTLCGPSGGGG